MKSFRVLPVILSLSAGEAVAFEYHGYMRSGLGFSDGGADQRCYSVPGAPEKFRLGNECDTYLVACFMHDFVPKTNEQSATWRSHLTLAVATAGHRDWESSQPKTKVENNSVSVSADLVTALREAFVSAGNVVSAESALWIGKRFYRRKDVHMLDFYYFDSSGPGFGLENYKAGPGSLHLAMTHQAPEVTGPSQKNFDVRYSGIPIGEGQLELAALYAAVGKTDAQTGEGNYESFSGSSFHIFLDTPLSSSLKNSLVVQYGQGLYGANGAWGSTMLDQRGGSGGQNIGKGDEELLEQRKGSKTLRVIEMLRAENVVENLSFDSVLLYQNVDYNGETFSVDGEDFEIAEKNELTVGIRPILKISEQFSLVSELGYQKVENAIRRNDGTFDDGQLTKFTIAPTVSPSVGIWARPALRFFVTYAQWNDESKGRVVSGNSQADKTTGLSGGAQFEAWW